MYLNFFRFKEYPFSLTPDTQFFLNQQSHQDALNTLMVALQQGEGFIKVVGEVGTGKTLLCRILLSKLHSPEYVTAFIPNPWINPDELKAFVASEIAAEYDRNMPAHELTSAIYRRLMQIARHNKKVVLILDEAQAMPRETIEALRLLTNLETEKRKLLQVVIFGQPELDVLLNRKNLRQLKQRIVFSEYLKPLTRSALVSYVQHRVDTSSASDGRKLFSYSALRLLHQASGGIPRLVNILAHKSLMAAYGLGNNQIQAWHVAKSIADTPESHWLGKFWSGIFRVNGRPSLANAAELPR